ncbi:hypothetical protein PENSPDRAFT_351045 [Peniophora sp. CONT]|nr:hypothetical protein PENSPDRAFT_351045 [Peniophora sp. CONT]
MRLVLWSEWTAAGSRRIRSEVSTEQRREASLGRLRENMFPSASQKSQRPPENRSGLFKVAAAILCASTAGAPMRTLLKQRHNLNILHRHL